MGHRNNEHWEVEHDIKIKKVKDDDGNGLIVFVIICIILGLLFGAN